MSKRLTPKQLTRLQSTFIIMAGGLQTRWEENFILESAQWSPKQLMPVDNGRWPVIGRTISMVQKFYNKSPFIVTDNTLIRMAAKAYDAFRIVEPKSTLLESILETREIWTPPVFILLGDVYYTEKCLRTIVEETKKPFVGTWLEIFSLRMDGGDFILWNSALKAAIGRYRKNPDDVKSKLWTLYYYICGLPLSGINHRIKSNFLLCEDGSTDFDIYDEYKEFIDSGLVDLDWTKN